MIEIFLKIIICSAVAFLFYRFLLSKILSIKESRAFLLIIPIVIIISSLIDLESFDSTIVNGGFLPTINVGDNLNQTVESSYVSVSLIYSIGIVLSMSYLLVGFVRIRKIRSESELLGKDESIKIYRTNINSCFSFLKSVFLPAESISKEHYLLEHEKNHILKRHYLDLLYYNILSVLLWFNPFVFMFLRELKIVHELEADEGELQNFKQTIFINKKIEFNQNLINGFSLRTYKRRLAMYNKGKTNRFLKLSLLILFVVAINIPTMMVGQDSTEMSDEEIVQPVYKGDLMKELSSTLVYPEEAKSNKVEGMVILKLNISKEGNLDDIEVEKGLGNGCDKEAMRVAETLKKWEAGTKDGKPVNMELILPIKFKLNEKDMDN